MAPKMAKKNMSKETFCGLFDWLGKTPEVRTIHLMGGEPTLHPDFEWFVEYLLAKDYPITVFSNLATPYAEVYAEKLADLPVSWVVNINPPYTWGDAQRKRILSALQVLGQKSSITFNIMPDDSDSFWAIELIKTYNLGRQIKVGFVLPTVTGSNYSLDDTEYSIVADKVVTLAIEAEKEDITMMYECGVPTCTFTDEQLGILWDTGSTFSSSCYSKLDITPDGECIYCLPLVTKAKAHYSMFDTYLDARQWFEKKWQPYRRLGNTAHCHTCNLMDPHICHGGCLAKMLLNAKNV